MKIEPIDIKDSCLAIQAWVKLVNRRCSALPKHERDEVKHIASKVILRMETLKQQVKECERHDPATPKA